MNARSLLTAALTLGATMPALVGSQQSQPPTQPVQRPSAGTAAALSPADVDAIRAASERYVQTSTSKDYPAWSALFTEDAVMMPPNGPAVIGRAEIEKWRRTLPPRRDARVEPLEFEGRGDLAIVRGRYSSVLTLPGQPEQPQSGKYIEVWRRQADGSWKLWRDIFNPDQPAVPAITRERAYAADMQLVQQALAADNLVRARELLQRHKPSAGETDLRGWEWRYLWQLCRPDYAEEVRRNVGATWSLALSGDGRWLAAGGPGRYSIWDVAGRKEVPGPKLAAGRGARVAFAPNRPLLAAVTSDAAPGGERVRYRVVLWDAEAGKLERELPLGAECGGLFFSRDGQTLVTSAFSPANAITLWNVNDGVAIRRIEAPVHGYGEGTPFAVTNDLSLAAHGTPGPRFRVVDLKTGRERWSAEATLPGNVVNAFAFSPDGRLLATAAGYEDPSIHLWDVATGKPLRRLDGHRRWVPALLFLADGKTLASAGGDLTIRLWDTTNGQLLDTLRGHQLEVWRVALEPDGKTLLSGGKDGRICRWDIAARRKDVAKLQLRNPIGTWRFAEDSQSLLTIDLRGRVARHQGRGFSEENAVMDLELTPGEAWHNKLVPEQISPDLRLVAVQRNEGKVEVWELTTRSRRHEFSVAANTYPLAVFRDHRTLRVFDDRKPDSIMCREWDLESGREVRSWRLAIRGSGTLLASFSTDARQCLTTSAAGTDVHDLEAGGTRAVKLLYGGRFPRFSPDGALVAVSLTGLHSAKIWEAAGYREVATLRAVTAVPHSVAFTPDGSRVVSAGSGSGGMILWSVTSHEPVLTLDASGSIYLSTAFSPDGSYLASRNTLLPDGNGILHLWRAPSWKEIEQAEASPTTIARNP